MMFSVLKSQIIRVSWSHTNPNSKHWILFVLITMVNWHLKSTIYHLIFIKSFQWHFKTLQCSQLKGDLDCWATIIIWYSKRITSHNWWLSTEQLSFDSFLVCPGIEVPCGAYFIIIQRKCTKTPRIVENGFQVFEWIIL